mgnify:CR=1 FL=1
MDVLIKEHTIVLSGAPLEEPYTIKLGITGPPGIFLCTPDGRKGYCVQKSEYNKVPVVARNLLKEGVSARKGNRNLVIQTFDSRAKG